MQTSDLIGLENSGASARRDGNSYFDNPMFRSAVPLDTERQIYDWHSGCVSWASGWLREDAGRDEALHSLMMVRYW